MIIIYKQMNYKLLIFTLLLLTNISYAKDNLKTYCFESPHIFFGNNSKSLKKLVFSFDDSNASAYYKSDVSLHYVLKNGQIYAAPDVYCHYDKHLYQCDHDMTDRLGGYFEFDLKRERINIEDFFLFDYGVNILAMGKLRDEGVEELMFYYLYNPTHGHLNTMDSYQNINDEKKKVWVKGYACQPIKKDDVTPQVYYAMEEYEELRPSPKNKELNIQYFYNVINELDSNTVTIHLANKYRTLAGMMVYEGFDSNWINHEDVELFIYNEKRAYFRIKEGVKTLSENTCLGSGVYLMELEGRRLLIKKFGNYSEI